MVKLTDKEQRFVDEYLIDLNATQAAIRAGYSTSAARTQSYLLLQKSKIRDAVEAKMAVRARRTGVNQDRVVRELARIAFLNMTDVIDMDDATIIHGATKEDTAAIASVKVKKIPTKEGDIVEREIKVADKLKALELLGKHFGMFQDNVKVTAVGGVEAYLKKLEEQEKRQGGESGADEF